MSISIQCPQGHRLKVDSSLQGKKVRCPKCKSAFVIPNETANGSLDFADPSGNLNSGNPTSSNPFPSAPPNFATDAGANCDTNAQWPSEGLAGDPFSQLSPLDAPTTAPAAINATYYQPPVKVVQPKKKVARPSNDGAASKVNLPIVLIGAALVAVSLVLVVGIVQVLFKMPAQLADSSANEPNQPASGEVEPPPPVYAPAHPEGLVESELLWNEYYNFVARQSEDIPEEVRFIDISSACNVIREKGYSSFALITPEEDRKLRAGEYDEVTKEKIEILESGVRLAIEKTKLNFFHFLGIPSREMSRRAEFSNTPAGERAYADKLTAEWREGLITLVFQRNLDKETCAKIHEVEDKCLGEDSIFKPEKKRLTEVRSDKLRLKEQIPIIAKAFDQFQEKYGQLPTDTGAPALTGTGLSWRVALLPFMGHQELYKKFHLDEPWDSPHNRQLVGQLPNEFVTYPHGMLNISRKDKQRLATFGQKPPEQILGLTSYHLIVGPGSIFDGSKRTKKEIVASHKKIMFAVLGGQDLVPWTKPGGLTMGQYNQQLPPLYFQEGTPFCTFDGRARLLTRDDLYIELSQPATPGISDSTFKQYANPMTFEHPNTEVEAFPSRRLRIRVTAVERKK